MKSYPITHNNVLEIPFPCWGQVEHWGGAKPGSYWKRYTRYEDLNSDMYDVPDSTVTRWAPDSEKEPA